MSSPDDHRNPATTFPVRDGFLQQTTHPAYRFPASRDRRIELPNSDAFGRLLDNDWSSLSTNSWAHTALQR